MATAKRTSDHGEIRGWVERKHGRPSIAGSGVLRIDFGKPEENLRETDWNEFFKIFDSSNVDFLYDPDGHFNKFVEKE
jgi:hypothetical protein